MLEMFKIHKNRLELIKIVNTGASSRKVLLQFSSIGMDAGPLQDQDYSSRHVGPTALGPDTSEQIAYADYRGSQLHGYRCGRKIEVSR